MKESRTQERVSNSGRLSLVKSGSDYDEPDTRREKPSRETAKHVNDEKVHYHYSYADFIQSYAEHINNLQRVNNRRGSKILQLYKSCFSRN